jgi:cell division protein FtsW (lipid II flippase)
VTAVSPIRSLRVALVGGALAGVVVGLGRYGMDARLGRTSPGTATAALGIAIATGALLVIGLVHRAVVLAVCTTLLSVIGGLVVYRVTGADGGSATAVSGGTVGILAVLAALAFMPRLRGWTLALHWKHIAVAGLALMALPLVPGLGRAYGHQGGTVAVPGLSAFMPGELGRPLVLIAIAGAVLVGLRPTARPGAVSARELLTAARPVAPVVVVAFALQLAQADLGPAAVLVAALGGGAALMLGRARVVVLSLAGLLVVVLLAAAVIPYVHTRVEAVREPLPTTTESVKIGQLGTARMALAWGGLTGVGLGGGVVTTRPAPRSDLADIPGLPAAGTDFGLAVAALELGTVGLVVVLLALAFMNADLWRRVDDAPDGAAYIMGGTLATMLTVQGTWVAAAVCGWLPHSGLAFPFLSAGGSSAAATALVVATIARLTDREDGAERAAADTQAGRRLGAGAVVAVIILAAITLVRTEGERLKLDRNPNNPQWRAKRADRGVTLARDGRVLQRATDTQSLQTISWEDTGPTAVTALLGDSYTDLTPSGAVGLTGVMRAAVRCGGSGQAELDGPGWRDGATVVDGDPARCRPAGLQTTLDADLVAAADRALAPSGGMFVALDAGNGDVLAAAARRGPDGLRAPTDALTLRLPPGSSIKPLVLASAIERGLDVNIPYGSVYTAADGTSIGGAPCGGTPEELLRVSCNHGFAQLAAEVGADGLRRTIGRLAPIDDALDGLAAASPELFADAGRPSAGAVAAVGIGQGAALFTPVALASAVATIADDGVAHGPRFVSALCAADGRSVLRSADAPGRRAIGTTAALRTIQAMRGPLEPGGTAQDLAAIGQLVAAKTGTAEIGVRPDVDVPGNVAWIVAVLDRPGAAPVVVVAAVPPTRGRPRPIGGQDAGGVLLRMDAALGQLSRSARTAPCRRKAV